jgi:hypothetical protein
LPLAGFDNIPPNSSLTALRYASGQISKEQKAMSKPAFRYSHYDLREQRAGTVIEITLSAVANVRLMNSSNFQRFT